MRSINRIFAPCQNTLCRPLRLQRARLIVAANLDRVRSRRRGASSFPVLPAHPDGQSRTT